MIIISIGRNPSNKIVIHDPSNTVSCNHGEIRITDNGDIYYRDHSHNGTMVNGKFIHNSEQLVQRCTPIVFPNNSQLDWNQVPRPSHLPNVKTEITIGRNSDNRIQLCGDNISRYHAVLKITNDGKYYIYDQSRNGTSVNGVKIPSFVDYQINRKDVIAFASSQQLDWGKVPESNKSSEPSKSNKSSEPSKSVKPIAYILPIAAVLVGVILLLLGDKYNWCGSDSNKVADNSYVHVVDSVVNISEKYSKTVCLVYCKYYLAYLKGEDTLCYMGKNAQIIDAKTERHKLENLPPFEHTGSGFFINKTGEIITNKHVAAPWENMSAEEKDEFLKKMSDFTTKKAAKKVLRNDYKTFVDILKLTLFGDGKVPEKIFSGVNYNPSISGVVVKTGVLINGVEIEKNDPYKDLIECRLKKIYKRDEIDIALIQTSQKTLPQGAEFIKETDIIPNSNDIKMDEEVTIIGFPIGLKFAHRNTDNIIKSTSTHGKVSRIPNRYEIQYDASSYGGASGSPVFNKKGQLIAVHYSGSSRNVTQGFNFGIIATFIKDIW